MFSEDEIYDVDEGEPISFDNLVEAETDAAWEDFDAAEAVDDYYSSCRALWDDIESKGVDGVRDDLWDDVKENLYSDICNARDNCDPDGIFEVAGHTYRCMAKWEVDF